MKLSYKDERDRCYGATGMAIAVVIFDGEDMVRGVNLDAAPEDMMEFTSDYYYSGNPRVSATTSWKAIVRNFNLAMGVSLANILCRRMVMEGRAAEQELIDELRSLALAEGTETCALEPDEAGHLFDKNRAYLQRVFSHRGVHSVAHEFAERLAADRRLSRLEMLEQLRSLSML